MNYRINKIDFEEAITIMLKGINYDMCKHSTVKALNIVITKWKEKQLDMYSIRVFKDSVLGFIYIPIKYDDSLPIIDLNTLNLLYSL